jgi:hypothetical protein
VWVIPDAVLFGTPSLPAADKSQHIGWQEQEQWQG